MVKWLNQDLFDWKDFVYDPKGTTSDLVNGIDCKRKS